MGPAVEPTRLSLIMIAAAIVLILLLAGAAFLFVRSRYRPPARQTEGPVEPGVPETRAP